MSEPKRHHYIPQFYLKRWKCSDGRICQFSRPYLSEVKPLRVHTKQTGFVDRLYSLRHASDELAERVEREFFSPADQLASDALCELEKPMSDANWTIAKRSAWSRFIMSLELRCPEDIDGMRQDWLRRYYEVDPELAEDYANIRLPEQPETMEEYLQQTSEAELEEGFFEALLSTIDSQRLGNTLTGMIWGKVEFSENENELITSDRPIIRTDRLARNHSHIVLPIGPKRLFFAAETQRVADEILAMNKKELVQNVNLQIVQQALKYVYARRDKPLRFVAKHMSSQQRPRVFQLLLAENARSHID